MIIEPKIRGFICTTAHPDGCREHVRQMVKTVEERESFDGPKRALIIGASTGYGLASRVALAFGAGTRTLGVMFEKEPTEKRTASAGYYNTKAFESMAEERGLYAKSLNGDAYSRDMKEAVLTAIREDLGQIDLLVYSLAAPRRVDETGETWSSVIKPYGQSYSSKTLNLSTNEIEEVSLDSATDEEIKATIKVMGGEDWQAWVRFLDEAGVLADQAKTLAYSYIGPELTFPIYKDGSIGQAKQDLYRTADALTAEFKPKNGLEAYVAINKAVVTQSSAAIPSVPLYISILYKIMKEAGTQEGYIEQMERLFSAKVYGPEGVLTDEQGLIRVDDREMEAATQAAVNEIWAKVTTENITEYTDLNGYWSDFHELFGFGLEGVDYQRDVDLEIDQGQADV